MNLQPLRDNVLIQPLDLSDEKVNGIYLAKADKLVINIAKVIATGTGTYTKKGKRIPVPVRPGQTIIYNSIELKDQTNIEGNYLISSGKIVATLEKSSSEDKTEINPVNGYVLLQPIDETKSGPVITIKEDGWDPKHATVVATSSDCTNSILAGDTVMYQPCYIVQYHPHYHKVGQVLVEEKYILCVLEQE